MKILGLDISTRTGWAFFEDAQLVSFGLIEKTKPSFDDYGEYPQNFILVALDVVDKILAKIEELKPDEIVIEEINKPGRFGSRFSQKILDFLHCLLILKLSGHKVYYINTSDWRKKLNLSVLETKKKAKPFLKELARLKKEFESAPKKEKANLKIQLDSLKAELKSKCIHAKIDKKSISVAHCNLTYNLSLKKGDNDPADAICQVEAYIKGVKPITNKDIFEKP